MTRWAPGALASGAGNQAGQFGQNPAGTHPSGPLGGKFAENVPLPVTAAWCSSAWNVPGSNNNLVLSDKECTHKSARTLAQCQAGNAEYAEQGRCQYRLAAQRLCQAGQQHAAGVVVFFRPTPVLTCQKPKTWMKAPCRSTRAIVPLMQALTGLTEQYAGQVLLVHGDTHFFKVDKPLYSPTRVRPNLTRLETFGSPVNHWVRVTVDTRRPEQVSPSRQ